MPKNQNRGALFAPPEITDYRAGNTLIEYKERNPSGQWDAWLPSGERQSRQDGDSFACVSFSNLNGIELQERFLTGIEPNYSDRFLAKMSGTTQEGNYANKVAQTVRDFGLVNENIWPFNEPFTWDTFYAEIPQLIQTEALRWKDKWDFRYQWVYYKNPFGPDEVKYTPELLMNELKHAPLQILSKVCSGWSTDPVVASCGQGSGHATLITGYEEGQYWKILDSYNPFNKKLAWDYGFQAVLKLVLTKKRNMSLLQTLEGKYVIRPEAHGEVYKVVNGELIYLDSNKNETNHIPLVDEVLRYAQKQNLFVGITEEQYNSIK